MSGRLAKVGSLDLLCFALKMEQVSIRARGLSAEISLEFVQVASVGLPWTFGWALLGPAARLEALRVANLQTSALSRDLVQGNNEKRIVLLGCSTHIASVVWFDE